MKNANTITALEALRKKEGDLLFDISVTLEGLVALTHAVHCTTDPEISDDGKPLMSTQMIANAILGLQKAVEKLGVFVEEGGCELSKEWNAVIEDER